MNILFGYSCKKYFTKSNILRFLILSLLSQILILIFTLVFTLKFEAIGLSFLFMPFYFPSIILLMVGKFKVFNQWYSKLSFIYPILILDIVFVGGFIYSEGNYSPSDGSSQMLTLALLILNAPIPFLFLIHKYLMK